MLLLGVCGRLQTAAPPRKPRLCAVQVVHDARSGQGAGAGGQMGDLLGAFNVATFKTSDEDDAAFWSRLIPEDERAAYQQEAQVGGRRRHSFLCFLLS